MNLTQIKKEKLIEKVYAWVARDAEVGLDKEKLLRMMIEATLDYLYTRGYINIEKEEKGNGEK